MMMTPGDGELLRLMIAGDPEAFNELYRRHQGRIYRFALLMSGSPNIAEEVTQEVFLVLIREAQRFDPARGALPAFLVGVARNQVLRCLERERSYVPFPENPEDHGGESVLPLITPDDPLGKCTRDEVIELVRTAVLALPARYREVVVLCDFQEMSYADAAVALGCPVGTVNSRLHRGHALLLKKLRSAGKVASTEAERTRCFA
jgi:RNA polymerase sigma-70 factor (ECF subfamily)